MSTPGATFGAKLKALFITKKTTNQTPSDGEKAAPKTPPKAIPPRKSSTNLPGVVLNTTPPSSRQGSATSTPPGNNSPTSKGTRNNSLKSQLGLINDDMRIDQQAENFNEAFPGINVSLAAAGEALKERLYAIDQNTPNKEALLATLLNECTQLYALIKPLLAAYHEIQRLDKAQDHIAISAPLHAKIQELQWYVNDVRKSITEHRTEITGGLYTRPGEEQLASEVDISADAALQKLNGPKLP